MKRPTTIDEMDPTTDASVSSDLRSCLILRQLLREMRDTWESEKAQAKVQSIHMHVEMNGIDSLTGSVRDFRGP
jgi:hypothetical protein